MCNEQPSVDLDGPTGAGPPPASARRNYLLGVFSGAAGTMSQDFLHPELILAALVYALTESKMAVALVTVISKAGVLAPQLLVGTRLEHHRRKRPYFIALSVARTLGLAVMIAAMGRLSRQSSPGALGAFLLAYLAVCVSLGASHVVFMDMAGRMIPPGRVGAFFGMRHFLGGMLAVALGFAVIQPVLTHVALPMSYLVLAVIGSVLAVGSMALFGLCREQPGPRARRRTTLAESLRRGMGWVRTDRNYRGYLWQRIIFRVNYLGLAFFIPYGKEKLAGGATDVVVLGGIMVATIKLSRTVASILWGRAADARGFRACFLGGGALFTVAPALALAAPHLPGAFAVPIPGARAVLDLPLLVYLLALAATGAALQGVVLGGTRFLITTAPPHRRISYTGFVNTITSPLTLLPLAGAWLAEAAGITALFVVVLFGGLLSLVAAARMTPEQTPRRLQAARNED